MSNATHDQPKLMEYFLQNPDDFNTKFQVDEVLGNNNLAGIICTDDASQYFKFSMDFNPSRSHKFGKH